MKSKKHLKPYAVEVYELHSQFFHVNAKNPAEAIRKVQDGKGTPSDDGSSYIEVADSYGLSLEGNEKLVEDLAALGGDTEEWGIPGIRYIEED